MKKYRYMLLALIIGCCSCDPAGDAGFYVSNKASGKIYLYATDSLITDSMVSGEKKMIVCDCGLGGSQVPSNLFDRGWANVSVLKVGNDSTICKKDITMESNWELVRLDKKQHEYVFTISDSDF